MPSIIKIHQPSSEMIVMVIIGELIMIIRNIIKPDILLGKPRLKKNYHLQTKLYIVQYMKFEAI